MRRSYQNFIINEVKWTSIAAGGFPSSNLCGWCGKNFGPDHQDFLYDVEHFNGRVINMSISYCSSSCCEHEIDRIMDALESRNDSQEEATED